MAANKRIVHVDPEIMHGTPVFVGTRVPVYTLFDYLKGGYLIDEFLEEFPSVSRTQVLAALEIAESAVISSAHSA